MKDTRPCARRPKAHTARTGTCLLTPTMSYQNIPGNSLYGTFFAHSIHCPRKCAFSIASSVKVRRTKFTQQNDKNTYHKRSSQRPKGVSNNPLSLIHEPFPSKHTIMPVYTSITLV